MTSSKNVTFGFSNIAENVWFLSFAPIISSNEPQRKTQFNLQSLGKSKTCYCAENIKIVSTNENLKKCSHLIALNFYVFIKMYRHAKEY